MIEWLTVISLIVVGIFLIVAEIIFVPGTTIVGILGLVAVIGGVYLGFDYFDTGTGSLILAGTGVFTVLALVLAFRSKAWKKFSLKNTNQAKFNENMTQGLSEGDQGETTSVLRPVGKAEFNDTEYEVKTLGNYLNSGTTIKIIKIDGNDIYVEPINS